MMMKIVFMCFILLSSAVLAEDSWYDDVVKIEVGLYTLKFSGTLSNPSSSIDFKNDLGHTSADASYFGIGVRVNNKYFLNNVEVNYFTMYEEHDATPGRTITAVSQDYNSSISSKIDYSVLNALIYEDFKAKGNRIHLFRNRYFYPGDIEFDLGVNVKYLNYLFQIKNLYVPANDSYRFDKVNAFIILPYLGVKYYFYRVSLFSNISVLSVGQAKSLSYRYGADFRVMKNVYLGMSYVYEEFEAKEKQDLIKFKTGGAKFNFKYTF